MPLCHIIWLEKKVVSFLAPILQDTNLRISQAALFYPLCCSKIKVGSEQKFPFHCIVQYPGFGYPKSSLVFYQLELRYQLCSILDLLILLSFSMNQTKIFVQHFYWLLGLVLDYDPCLPHLVQPVCRDLMQVDAVNNEKIIHMYLFFKKFVKNKIA